MSLEDEVRRIVDGHRTELGRILAKAGADSALGRTLLALPVIAAANIGLDCLFMQGLSQVLGDSWQHMRFLDPANIYLKGAGFRIMTQMTLVYGVSLWTQATPFLSRKRRKKALLKSLASWSTLPAIALAGVTLHRAAQLEPYALHAVLHPQPGQEAAQILLAANNSLKYLTALSAAAMMGVSAKYTFSMVEASGFRAHWEERKEELARTRAGKNRWISQWLRPRASAKDNYAALQAVSKRATGTERAFILDQATRAIQEHHGRLGKLLSHNLHMRYYLTDAHRYMLMHPGDPTRILFTGDMYTLADPDLGERFYTALFEDPAIGLDTKILAAIRTSAMDSTQATAHWHAILASLEQAEKEVLSGSEREVYASVASPYTGQRLIVKQSRDDLFERYLVDAWAWNTTRRLAEHTQKLVTEQPLAYLTRLSPEGAHHVQIHSRVLHRPLTHLLADSSDHTALFQHTLRRFLQFRDTLTTAYEDKGGACGSYRGIPYAVCLEAPPLDESLIGRAVHGYPRDQLLRFFGTAKEQATYEGAVRELIQQQDGQLEQDTVTVNDLWSSNILGGSVFIDNRFSLSHRISDLVHFSLDPAVRLPYEQKMDLVNEEAGLPADDQKLLRFWTWYHAQGLAGAHLARRERTAASGIISTAHAYCRGTDLGDHLSWYASVQGFDLRPGKGITA